MQLRIILVLLWLPSAIAYPNGPGSCNLLNEGIGTGGMSLNVGDGGINQDGLTVSFDQPCYTTNGPAIQVTLSGTSFCGWVIGMKDDLGDGNELGSGTADLRGQWTTRGNVRNVCGANLWTHGSTGDATTQTSIVNTWTPMGTATTVRVGGAILSGACGNTLTKRTLLSAALPMCPTPTPSPSPSPSPGPSPTPQATPTPEASPMMGATTFAGAQTPSPSPSPVGVAPPPAQAPPPPPPPAPPVVAPPPAPPSPPPALPPSPPPSGEDYYSCCVDNACVTGPTESTCGGAGASRTDTELNVPCTGKSCDGTTTIDCFVPCEDDNDCVRSGGQEDGVCATSGRCQESGSALELLPCPRFDETCCAFITGYECQGDGYCGNPPPPPPTTEGDDQAEKDDEDSTSSRIVAYGLLFLL